MTPLTVNEKTAVFSKASNALAVELHKQVTKSGENGCVSSASIMIALNMLHLGARGKTKAQMTQVLHSPDNPVVLGQSIVRWAASLSAWSEEGQELSIVNTFWLQAGLPILKEYFAHLRRFHDTALHLVDFRKEPERILERINQRVLDQTHGRIQRLLGPDAVNSDTSMVLTNTVYFAGVWAKPFTIPESDEFMFYPESGERIHWTGMVRTGSMDYCESDGLQVLEIPYRGGRFSMTIFLPLEKGGLANIEASMTASRLTQWTDQLEEREVSVTLPKFKVNSRLKLKGNLETMGMTDAFNRRADFSGITGSKVLRADQVIHAAEVDVDEEGTVAAAATAIVGRFTCCPPTEPRVVFNANHPFLFIIKDKVSDLILFMGRFAQPK